MKSVTLDYNNNNQSPQGDRRLNQSPAQRGIPGFTLPQIPAPYSLQIKAIPYGERVTPTLNCRLLHLESGYRVPGQFSYEEATEIQEITRYWDWRIDKGKKPRCSGKLLALLEAMLGQEEDPNRFPLPAQKKAAKGGAANA